MSADYSSPAQFLVVQVKRVLAKRKSMHKEYTYAEGNKHRENTGWGKRERAQRMSECVQICSEECAAIQRDFIEKRKGRSERKDSKKAEIQNNI